MGVAEELQTQGAERQGRAAAAAGGYRASVEIRKGKGKAPMVRQDFACEEGGDEWADPRPDFDRLRAIARATGGELVEVADLASLDLPEATPIDAERQVHPVAPPGVDERGRVPARRTRAGAEAAGVVLSGRGGARHASAAWSFSDASRATPCAAR